MRIVLRRIAFGVLSTGIIAATVVGATTVAASAGVTGRHATTKTAPKDLSWPAVKETAKGNRVLTIQYLLNERGHKVSITGTFGADTKTQVVAFQKAHSISPADGIVGDKTWQELVVKELHQGQKGDAVKAVQSYLKRAYGHKDLVVSGDFGDATVTAVKDFQKKHKLGDTGKVDLVTWNALVKDAL
jgi:peptidoglycan hydrolase-like protein with peptidoglycan-binding domain